MNPMTTLYRDSGFEQALVSISDFFGMVAWQTAYYYGILPDFAQFLIVVLLFFSITGILASHIVAIYRNRKEWKPKPDSQLMFSYSCGSGAFRRKKIYHTASQLLWDKTWFVFSIAGCAYRLGNLSPASDLLAFLCSLLYLPLAMLGVVEMTLRILLGTVWLLCSGLVYRVVLLVLHLLSYLLMPLWQMADRVARNEQHCPHCYQTFDLPGFQCPSCGAVHKQLLPSRCGLLVARCECGRFLSTTAFTGRSRLKAVCPKCGGRLAAGNAKQFTMQLIGGNTAGKTAFLAAFQHQYLGVDRRRRRAVQGAPKEAFQKLEQMYQQGQTEPSAADSIIQVYHFIEKTKRVAKHDLVIYDIPDEAIISGVYERNPLHFGFSNGIILLVDPLSVASVREECLKAGDAVATEDYSKDDVDTIIVRFIHQYSEIIGRSARKMIGIPVAVLISKADVKAVKRVVGLPRIKATYTANPGAYRNDLAVARDEICRRYLLDLGLTNALNNLESVFANVCYFPVSAIGHASEANTPFSPFGVVSPILWIANKAKAGIPSLIQKGEKVS